TVVAAEGRTGQRQTTGRVPERFENALTPALRVATVVDLVEDHQGATRLRAHAVFERMRGDLRVGDHDALVVARRLPGGVREVRVERDADAGSGTRPLVLEVLGGGDDGDLVDRPVAQQLRRHPEGEGRLTG